jgi:hypothetical protein
MLSLALASSIAWAVLAAIGVRRGLRREVIIFRSWGDCTATAALLVCGTLGLVRLNLPQDFARVLCVIALAGAVPWLWATRMDNRRARDLWTVVPAKITLVALVALAAGLAYSCGKSALSPKTESRQRVANAAIAAGSAAATWGLFRVIRQLVSADENIGQAN